MDKIIDQPNFGAFIVSMVITVAFAAVFILSCFHSLPETPLMQNMSSTLNAAFVAVWGFWLGSSSSSRLKDATIARVTPTAPSAPTPTPTPTPTTVPPPPTGA